MGFEHAKAILWTLAALVAVGSGMRRPSNKAKASPLQRPETQLPPANGDPVHLFWQGGQSECVGQAAAGKLRRDMSPGFEGFKGQPNNIWMASTVGTGMDSFFIAKLAPDVAGSMFGVELGFSRRYHEVTGARVLIVKYCIGGTTVREHWKPDAPGNVWDYDADNGTAEWLWENDRPTFSKADLFKTNVYVTRRAIEALEAANVPYEWKGIIWIQGAGDRTGDTPSSAEKFGQDTARLWDAVRDRAIGIPDLPIVDRGAGSHQVLMSGKAIAGQLVKGCNVVHVEEAQFIQDSENTYLNAALFNYYGWDPLMPEELKPVGSNTFPWFKEFPRNSHSEYGGMLLQSTSMANAFILKFTTFALGRTMRAMDPALKFPFDPCTDDQLPSNDTLCWIDERDPDSRDECVPQV